MKYLIIILIILFITACTDFKPVVELVNTKGQLESADTLILLTSNNTTFKIKNLRTQLVSILNKKECDCTYKLTGEYIED